MLSQATDWTSRLKRAMWRGFEFMTESHDSSHGERLVVTELPGADQPVVEALGAKADGYKVAAYFIGPSYDLQRYKFLSLLRDGGADWLTHPWLGEVWVRAHNWSVHESNDKGGYCTVSVDFVPGGQAPFVPTVDMVDTVFAAKDKMVKAGPFTFVSMTAQAMRQFLAQVQSKLDVVRNALAMARMPLTMAQQMMGAVDSAKGLLGEALAVPGGYASALHSMANALGASASDGLSDAQRVRVVGALSRQVAMLAKSDAAGVAPTVKSNLAVNDVAMGGLLLGAAVELGLADYSSTAARDAVQASVLGAFDVLMPRMTDEQFFAAAIARAAFMDAMQAQMLTSGAVYVAQALPATVLSYRYGLDESVLIERNGVRHPLFVMGVVHV